jgi:hypothetical protein
MYVEGVGQKSGPCTATFIDLLRNSIISMSILDFKDLIIFVISLVDKDKKRRGGKEFKTFCNKQL